MERNEISKQEIDVYLFMKNHKKWATNKEIAQGAKVPERTVRFKTKKFVDMGLCDLAEVFPGHRYRLSDKADKRNSSYVKRIEAAVAVFND